MEYLYSDEGQIGWLKGYCHPIRFDDLVKNADAIPADLLAKLPDIAGAVFPTLDAAARGRQGPDHQEVGHRSSARTSSSVRQRRRPDGCRSVR